MPLIVRAPPIRFCTAKRRAAGWRDGVVGMTLVTTGNDRRGRPGVVRISDPSLREGVLRVLPSAPVGDERIPGTERRMLALSRWNGCG